MYLGNLSGIINEGALDSVSKWSKKKYREMMNGPTKKDYEEFTKNNKESRWNKLNNRFFKVHDKNGETIAGGALKTGTIYAAPMIPLGPAFTFGAGAIGGTVGAASTALSRFSNKQKYKKYWKEER